MAAKGQTQSLVTDEGRVCTGPCGEFKPWSEFYKSAASCRGYQARCKVCDSRPSGTAGHPKPAGQAPKSRRSWQVTPEGRECPGCKAFKLWAEFSPSPRTKTGYFSRCRNCRNKTAMDANFSYRFAITSTEYLQMLAQQNGACELCLKPETQLHPSAKIIMRLAIDHDHTCPLHIPLNGCRKCIRGLLCNRCNRMIALVELSGPAVTARFADYLALRPLALAA